MFEQGPGFYKNIKETSRSDPIISDAFYVVLLNLKH